MICFGLQQNRILSHWNLDYDQGLANIYAIEFNILFFTINTIDSHQSLTLEIFK